MTEVPLTLQRNALPAGKRRQLIDWCIDGYFALSVAFAIGVCIWAVVQ